MPRFTPDHLRTVGRAMFEAAGCSAPDASIVADHLVESSLFGHDSHGTLRMYEYVDQIAAGTFSPTGRPRVERQRGVTACIDGDRALGQVAGKLAVDTGIDLAHTHGVSVITVRNCSHLGRIGAYPLAVARQGLIGQAFVNAGRLGRQIPPYGGIDGRISTNPIAFAAPRSSGDPILVDMTTSVVAEGKIRVAHNRGEDVPAGWITDPEGQPTQDPRQFLDPPGGAILPLGGPVAYKGYCLGMMVEMLGGILSGEGTANGEVRMRSNGMLLTIYDPSFFCEDEKYDLELESLISHVLGSRIDPAVGRIRLPGSPEFDTARDRNRDGIPVDDTTWNRILERARRLGLDTQDWTQAAIAP
ncbi:MAG: Ldh family oxidoreductase [Gemmatimonadetes bacterium]|nr:Ldh family oxidoreductase [Gemmatimonadota bacterium]MBT7860022.1 Ldh family oxidoreductase [Gemmatimonadota bacterium]